MFTKLWLTLLYVFAAMAFHTKVDFLQQERNELPQRRPVIIYLVAPTISKDYTLRTPHYKHFKEEPELPAGIRKREGNPYNLCLIEANTSLERFDSQLVAAFDSYKEAAYKVLVINAHATAEGVLLKSEVGEGEEKVFLTGRHLAQLISEHTHKNFVHILVLTAYGHRFADSSYTFIQQGTHQDVRSLVAITCFTSEASPTTWDRLATSGNAHSEIKRDIGEFMHDTVEPNSPYKALDGQLAKPQCVVL